MRNTIKSTWEEQKRRVESKRSEAEFMSTKAEEIAAAAKKEQQEKYKLMLEGKIEVDPALIA